MSKKNLPDVTRKKISNERLVKMLSERQWTQKELDEMGVKEFQLVELTNLNYDVHKQYDPVANDFVRYIVPKGGVPMIYLPHEAGTPLKLAKIADLHIGSSEVDNKEIVSLLSYLWETGIRIITISGDIVDGYGVYKGQVTNLAMSTIQRQAAAAVSVLSLFDFTYIAVRGNHDESSTKSAGVDVISLIEAEMVLRKKKFTYLCGYAGLVIFDGVAIQIMHMDGGKSATSDTYGSQKLMDNFFKSAVGGDVNAKVNEVKVFDKMVPVINVVTGHYHTLAKFVYGKVLVESPLTTQHTTDLILRRGINAKTGARVSELLVEGGKLVSEKGHIVFSKDVNELYKMSQMTTLKQADLPTPKRKKKVQETVEPGTIDEEKINKALKLLFKKRYWPQSDLGLSDEEIAYINEKFNYGIRVNEEGMVILNTQADESLVVLSPIRGTGIVRYMEVSNLLVGSVFFDEAAFRRMLDTAKEQKIRHIHLGGNLIWGKATNAQHTTLFTARKQIDKLKEILLDYPEFHYWSINGATEKSIIEDPKRSERFNPLKQLSEELRASGVKLTAINSAKCDFLIYGLVFRMANDQTKLSTTYTRDYPMVIRQRDMLAKNGNALKINDVDYNFGAIFYGHIANTIETHHGLIYLTTAGGPSVDSYNLSKVVQSNAEAAIVNAYVKNGEIIKFEREVIIE